MATNRKKASNMKVVKSGTRKSKVNVVQNTISDRIIGLLVLPFWITWQAIKIPYLLIMGFPNQKSNLLGFFRVIFWTSILYFVNFDNKKEDSFSLFVAWFGPLVCVFFLISSIIVMFGGNYHMEGTYKIPTPGLENHPNIQSSMEIMDAQLSSYGTRSNFIDKFLGK